jgi:hypothetical protein
MKTISQSEIILMGYRLVGVNLHSGKSVFIQLNCGTVKKLRKFNTSILIICVRHV